MFETALSTSGSRFTLPLKPPPDPVTTRLFPVVLIPVTTPSAPEGKGTEPPPSDNIKLLPVKLMVCNSLVSSSSPSLYKAPPSVPAVIEFGVSALTIV